MKTLIGAVTVLLIGAMALVVPVTITWVAAHFIAKWW